MPKIQFDVLVPDRESIDLAGKFSTLAQQISSHGLIGDFITVHDPAPRVDEALAEQLRQTYRDEHEGESLEVASINRYSVEVFDVQGSVNQITMILSRLLTPPADLPKDAPALEQELRHEVPARYPWYVQIIS